MKVELSIADDRELRQVIRDTIKGEVVSIARGEIKAILAEVVGERVVPKTEKEMDTMVRELVQAEVKCVLHESSGSWNGPDRLTVLTREEIAKYLRELWEKRPPQV